MGSKTTYSLAAASVTLITALYLGTAVAGNHDTHACEDSHGHASFCNSSGNAIEVPEPNTIALLGATLMALGARGLLSSKRKSSADTKLSPPNIKNEELPNL